MVPCPHSAKRYRIGGTIIPVERRKRSGGFCGNVKVLWQNELVVPITPLLSSMMYLFSQNKKTPTNGY